MTLRPLPVRESQVMGRLAVVVMVACWQLPVGGYLVGVDPSAAITDRTTGDLVPLVWVGSFALAQALILGMYAVKLDRDKNLLEIAALVVFLAAITVYLVALTEGRPSPNGLLAIGALLLSLVVNVAGRIALLVRQLRAAAKMRRELEREQ